MGEGHEGNEGDEGDEGYEGHEGHEEAQAQTQKRYAFAGKLSKTVSGLTKSDLVKNKHGRGVSKKRSLRGSKNKWIDAVMKARKALGTKGFAKVKKGTPLYTKAKSLFR